MRVSIKHKILQDNSYQKEYDFISSFDGADIIIYEEWIQIADKKGKLYKSKYEENEIIPCDGYSNVLNYFRIDNFELTLFIVVNSESSCIISKNLFFIGVFPKDSDDFKCLIGFETQEDITKFNTIEQIPYPSNISKTIEEINSIMNQALENTFGLENINFKKFPRIIKHKLFREFVPSTIILKNIAEDINIFEWVKPIYSGWLSLKDVTKIITEKNRIQFEIDLDLPDLYRETSMHPFLGRVRVVSYFYLPNLSSDELSIHENSLLLTYQTLTFIDSVSAALFFKFIMETAFFEIEQVNRDEKNEVYSILYSKDNIKFGIVFLDKVGEDYATLAISLLKEK